MRLVRHINERFVAITDDMKMLLSRDCMPYIKEVKSIIDHKPHYLYRGMQTHETFFKKTVRTDREPTDSNPQWHNALDDEFHKKFGVKPRSSGVFCSFIHPSGYGHTYIVFPIGSYKFIFSQQVADLYMMEPLGLDLGQILIKSEELVKTYIITNHFTDVVNKIGDKKNEIMLICKEYYAVEYDYREKELDGWIKNEL